MEKFCDMRIMKFGELLPSFLLDLMQIYFIDNHNIGINGEEGFILYNITKNIGFRYDKLAKINVFRLDVEDDNRTTISLSGMYITVKDNQISSSYNFSSKGFVKNCMTYYYHSRYCSWENDLSESYEFITCYGSAPTFLSNFFELIAKKYFDAGYMRDEIPYPIGYDDDTGSDECSYNNSAEYYRDECL